MALRGHEFLIEPGRKVALTSVADDGDDEFAFVLGALCDLEGSPDVSASGDASEDTLVASESATRFAGVFMVGEDDFVDEIPTEDVGDEAGADALDFVRCR